MGRPGYATYMLIRNMVAKRILSSACWLCFKHCAVYCNVFLQDGTCWIQGSASAYRLLFYLPLTLYIAAAIALLVVISYRRHTIFGAANRRNILWRTSAFVVAFVAMWLMPCAFRWYQVCHSAVVIDYQSVRCDCCGWGHVDWTSTDALADGTRSSPPAVILLPCGCCCCMISRSPSRGSSTAVCGPHRRCSGSMYQPLGTTAADGLAGSLARLEWVIVVEQHWVMRTRLLPPVKPGMLDSVWGHRMRSIHRQQTRLT